MLRFGALAWCGILEDPAGHRNAALAFYRKALGADPGSAMSLSGLKVRLDRARLEQRQRSPFRREAALSPQARPTGAELESIVSDMDYSNEGRNLMLIFEKTAGLSAFTSWV